MYNDYKDYSSHDKWDAPSQCHMIYSGRDKKTDKQLNELQDKISTQSEKLKLVVDAGKVMQNKSFNIKNALDHQKFMGGAF